MPLGKDAEEGPSLQGPALRGAPGFERGAVGVGGGGGALDVDRLISLARERDRLGEPLVRAQLAALYVESRVMALTARRAGCVTGIAVSVGTQVAEGARLMTIEAESRD